MSAENNKSSGIPLDYGTETPAWKRYWNRFHAWWQAHSDYWWESIGYFFGMATFSAGGPKQLTLALGLAFLAGGLGLAIEHGEGGTGHFWMWIGGFMIGLIIPLSKPEARK